MGITQSSNKISFTDYLLGVRDEISKHHTPKFVQFSLNSVQELKQFTSSLSDNQFNPSGIARVDITKEGFLITVHSAKMKATANLFVKPSSLITFHCSRPIEGKLVNVAEFNEFLLTGTKEKEDCLVLHHSEGSNHLRFYFTSAPATKYHLQFLEKKWRIERPLLKVVFLCEAMLSSNMLSQIVNQLKTTTASQKVVWKIKENTVEIIIGSKTLSDDISKPLRNTIVAETVVSGKHFLPMELSSGFAPSIHLGFHKALMGDGMGSVNNRVTLRLNCNKFGYFTLFLNHAKLLDSEIEPWGDRLLTSVNGLKQLIYDLREVESDLEQP